LFESQSKTLFRVLFSSLYLQIPIFYFGISTYVNFTWQVRPEIHFRSAKTLHCLNQIAREMSEIDSKSQITPAVWFAHASGHRCFLMANFSVWRAHASKTRIFWKIQNKYISTGHIQTKFSTRKRLNTRVFHSDVSNLIWRLLTYLHGLFTKRRNPASHLLIFMISDELRNCKPYAASVRFLPYKSLTDKMLRDLQLEVEHVQFKNQFTLKTNYTVNSWKQSPFIIIQNLNYIETN
jgi:hypothetical protein